MRGEQLLHAIGADAPFERAVDVRIEGGGGKLRALMQREVKSEQSPAGVLEAVELRGERRGQLRAADQVFEGLMHVEGRGDELAGQKCYRDRAVADPKIEIHSNTIVTEILGEAAVAGLRMRDMKSGTVSEIEVAAVFAYVGLQPNTGFVQDLLSLDSAGRIAADALTRTEMPGVFAVGTIRAQSPCRAASAAGDGATAAVAADRYLANGSWSAHEMIQDREALRAVAPG